MPTTRRCVFGCVTTGVSLHSFPQPTTFPERFRLWVEMAGDSLKNLSNDYIYKYKKVCDIHFTHEFRNRNNRLNALALPTLNLSGNSKDDSQNTVESQMFSSKNEPADGNSKDDSQGTVESQTFSSKNEPADDQTDEKLCQKDATSFSWLEPSVTACSIDDDVETNSAFDDLDTHSMYDDPVTVDIKPVALQEQGTTNDGDQNHVGYTCNECKRQIIRFRYACIQCKDYDICSMCEARGVHDTHYMLRIPRPRPPVEIRNVMEVVRAQVLNMLTDSKYKIELLDAVEIKNEVEDPLQVKETVTPLDISAEEHEDCLGMDDTSSMVLEENKEVIQEKVLNNDFIKVKIETTAVKTKIPDKIIKQISKDNVIILSTPLKRLNVISDISKNKLSKEKILNRIPKHLLSQAKILSSTRKNVLSQAKMLSSTPKNVLSQADVMTSTPKNVPSQAKIMTSIPENLLCPKVPLVETSSIKNESGKRKILTVEGKLEDETSSTDFDEVKKVKMKQGSEIEIQSISEHGYKSADVAQSKDLNEAKTFKMKQFSKKNEQITERK